MIRNFQAYDLAVQLMKQVKGIEAPGYSKDQLLRAAQSIVLNLAEGSGKPSTKEKKRFYSIAFGSTREVQGLFDILEVQDKKMIDLVDHVAACIYKLVYCQKR